MPKFRAPDGHTVETVRYAHDGRPGSAREVLFVRRPTGHMLAEVATVDELVALGIDLAALTELKES